MGLLYVQTWVISKGKTREHEEAAMKILPKARKLAPCRYFSQRHGPMGARVWILEFDTDADYQKYFDTSGKDE